MDAKAMVPNRVINLNPKHKTRRMIFLEKYGAGYLFLAPFLILFITFVIVPVIVAFGMSFTYYNLLEPPSFVGLANFKNLFLNDEIFILAIKNTIVFALITGPFGYILSFLVAWLIDQLRFRNILALAFYAPSITSYIAMSIVWLYFFSSDRYGFINNFLINLGFISEPILWTMNANTILPVAMVISAWMGMGNGFLVFLAGLKGIPKEMYEVGAIDGISGKLQELWYITLPLSKPQLLFGAVNSVVATFGVFDIVVSIAGIPSPNYAAHTIVAHLFDYAFIRFEMGYSAAIAIVLFTMTFTLGRICMKVFASKDVW